jgi:heterotetrameric sarcosine oxidase gamma subunit
MAEAQDRNEPLRGAGLSVRIDSAMRAASLRYFATDGAVAAAVSAVTGATLPGNLQAKQAGAVARSGTGEAAVTRPLETDWTLAWRSPDETLCFTRDGARLAELQTRVAGAADGCLVDLSSGLTVMRVSGERVAELLCRLGGTASVPSVGEARRSRLADVPVLALCVREGETLLVLDRSYAPHLLGWIRETLADLAA